MATQYYRFALALGIGILIGLQREYAYDDVENKLFAGIRTFSLISLFGCASALISEQLGSALPFLGATAILGMLIGVAYYVDAVQGKLGLTTEIAAILTFLVGAMSYWGFIVLSAALGVIITVMLALKKPFRHLAHNITPEDIYASLTFAVISVIVLPILPNQAYGPPPFDVLNPYRIWLMVVFISGISFLGYVLIKVVGAQMGIGLTGLLGGLASSTAVTLSFTQRSRTNSELTRAFAFAIIVAWTMMFGRVLVVVFALHPPLALTLLLPMAASAAVGLIYGAYLYFRQGATTKEEDIHFVNPFELGPAIQFGLIFAGVLVLSSGARHYFGDTGIYLSSVVASLTDVNAIALSMVDLAQGPNALDITVASRAIIIAAMTNTLVKGGFVMVSGSPELRKVMAPGLALMLVVGSLTGFLL